MSVLANLSSQLGEKTEEGNRKVAVLCLENPALLVEIGEGLNSHDAVLQGDCAEVMTKVADVNAELVVPFADSLMSLLSHNTTRVRWEAMHAISFITPYISDRIDQLFPFLEGVIQRDKSTIVRDYALETVCQFSNLGLAQAQKAFPILKTALNVWEGKHRARALKGFLYVTNHSSEHTLEIRGFAEEYRDDNRGIVKKAAKAIIKAIDHTK